MRLRKINQRGVTLVELMIAASIMAIMATSVIAARGLMAKQTVRTNDRAFATQKAIQMFAELKSLISGSETGVQILDNYQDGSAYNTVLTTDKNVDTAPPGSGNAGNALSQNRQSDGNWRFLRQISVVPLVNDSSARLVTVKVWRYQSDQNPLQPGELLSEVGGILRTSATLQNPTQVLDVYFIDINNIQGWWSQVPSLVSNIQSSFGNIESAANNTLQIRPHYITRSSYGRDQQYVPFINEATSTTATASSWVYLYPGSTPQDSGVTANFYQPDGGLSGVLQDGAFNIDGTIQNPVSLTNGVNYAVADQYNDSVRYPDELAIYQAVTTAYATSSNTTASNPITEISERMLIEGMLSAPQSFTNALIVNLHGELLPLPPMRNYSDAAKDPVNYPDYRLVTHPENLFYPAAAGATVNVNLRVYGYMDGFDAVTQLNGVTASSVATMPYVTAQITLPGLVYSAAQAATINGICTYGDSSADPYKSYPVTNNAASGAVTGPFGMGMSVYSSSTDVYTNSYGNPVTGFTQITLNGVPVRCPQNPDGSGLNAADRLYGLEYIPCSPDETAWSTTFSAKPLTVISSTAATTGNPKNTASWVITLPMPALAPTAQNPVTCQEIDTQIVGGDNGSPSTPGFPNISKTYVWVGNSNLPPYTERYQFIGDPRHCPYLDVKVGGPAAGSVSILPNGYNWYFKNISNGATGVDGYKGFLNTANGWGNYSGSGVNIGVDLPRFYQMIRNGLLNTTSIFSTVNGWSFYYYGLGGELGYDQSPYSNGVSYVQAPWASAAATMNSVGSSDEIITETWVSADTQHARMPANVLKKSGGTTILAKDAWYAKPWLGDLYPDSQYSTFWSVWGNLPTLAGSTDSVDPIQFFREDFGNISTGGNSLNGFHGLSEGKAADSEGSNAFYEAQSGGGQFQHESLGGAPVGTLSTMGTNTYNIFNFSLSGSVDSPRPWSITSTNSPAPLEWSATGLNNYASNTLSIPNITAGVSDIFYNSDQGGAWNSTGIVKITSPSSQVAYVIESGLATSANVGTNTLGTYALIFVLRSFLDGGMLASPGSVGHITQLPLIEASLDQVTGEYANPSSIGITISSPVLSAGTTLVPSAPVTNLWYRFPGFSSTTGNFYTELYPGYNNLLSSTYNEMSGAHPVTLLYNLIYSPDGTNWFYCQDNQPATPGILGTTGSEAVTAATSAPYLYSWNVSNSTQFPQGDYQVQAEAFRLGYNLHYSYHQILAIIDR